MLQRAARGGARAVRGGDAAEPRGRRHLDGRDQPQQPRQRDARRSATTPTARAHYADSLRVYRDYDDQWALAFLLEDVALLAALTGRSATRARAARGVESLREEIGSPRAPSFQAELDEQLAPARLQLGPAGDAALSRGRALTLDQAVSVALELCAPA